ncbi:MAG: hypothetical protein KDJ88_00465 [Bauldia sp.]|nr:hypothetical protein [Bauldia sp.]
MNKNAAGSKRGQANPPVTLERDRRREKPGCASNLLRLADASAMPPWMTLATLGGQRTALPDRA